MSDTKTADRILDAADALFGEVGFDGVSVRDVAERADVNKASVFYYYNSKGELFRTVLERYYEHQHEALREAFEQTSGSLRERFHRGMDAYFDFVAENHRYPRLVQRILTSDSQQVEFIQRSLSPLYDWIGEQLEEVAPEEGPLATRQFFVTISGAVLTYFTYEPALKDRWEMLSDEALEERRDHLHWMIDVFIDRLEERDAGD